MTRFFSVTISNKNNSLCSIKRRDSIIHFYIDDENKLKAEIIHDGKREGALLIKGIPSEWQTKLDNTEKKEIIKKKLMDESFLTIESGNVVVNPKGLGGWGKKQHKGYYRIDTPMFLITRKYYVRYFINKAGEGTFLWYRDYEAILKGYSDGRDKVFWDNDAPNGSAHAQILANACDSVDTGDTNPTQFLNSDAQSWHFNVNKNCLGGTQKDSRIGHAVDCLLEAVTQKDKPGDLCLQTLGKGLHPLQDVFAHTDAFVQYYDRGEGHHLQFFYGHIDLQHYARSGNADLPTYIDSNKYSFVSAIMDDKKSVLSQRYSDTKTVSYIYIYLFHLLRGLPKNQGFENCIAERLSASLNAKNFSDNEQNTLFIRGTHGIAGFLLALKIALNKQSGVNIMYAINYTNSLIAHFPADFFVDNEKSDVIGLPLNPVHDNLIKLDATNFGILVNLVTKIYTRDKNDDKEDSPVDYTGLHPSNKTCIRFS